MNEAQKSTIIDAIKRCEQGQERVLVGIAGPPGSGKSTFADELAEGLNTPAAVLPMDGFHLDNAVLRSKGIFHRKGAPETFDSAGFVGLVRKLRGEGSVSYPTFDRPSDCVVSDGGAISATNRVVLIEGNYLLLQTSPWSDLADLFDLTVYLEVPREVLKTRLVSRWETHGMGAAAALKRAEGNDMINVDLVQNNSRTADLTIQNDK
jgi:pantothenate kinase